MAFIADQGEIESTVTQILEDIPPPACEGDANLSGDRQDLAAQYRRDDRGRIIRCRNSEGTMFCHRVECRTRDEPIQFRQHDLKLSKNTFPLRRRLKKLFCPNNQ